MMIRCPADTDADAVVGALSASLRDWTTINYYNLLDSVRATD